MAAWCSPSISSKSSKIGRAGLESSIPLWRTIMAYLRTLRATFYNLPACKYEAGGIRLNSGQFCNRNCEGGGESKTCIAEAPFNCSNMFVGFLPLAGRACKENPQRRANGRSQATRRDHRLANKEKLSTKLVLTQKKLLWRKAIKTKIAENKVITLLSVEKQCSVFLPKKADTGGQ